MGFMAFLHVGNKYHQQKTFRISIAYEEVESIDWLKLKSTLVHKWGLSDVNLCSRDQLKNIRFYSHLLADMKKERLAYALRLSQRFGMLFLSEVYITK